MTPIDKLQHHWPRAHVNSLSSKMPPHQAQLSFCLPIALKERFFLSESSTHRGHWRHPTWANAFLRINFLLRTFTHFFDQQNLSEFVIIAPFRDCAVLDITLRSHTNDPRYRVVPEEQLISCSGYLTPTHSLDGWRLQQMIKLLFALSCPTTHYVTLDSDVFCNRPFGAASLLIDGRAATNVELPDDYRELYSAAFAHREIAIKQTRLVKAYSLLRVEDRYHSLERFFGETPVVLSRNAVIRLLHHLEDRHGKDAFDKLGGLTGWTEYALYYAYLSSEGTLEQECYCLPCNSILDLSRSVWHPSRRYRSDRNYDASHFLSGDPGLFTAIQSWIPPSAWLPPNYKTLEALYGLLSEWLSL